MYSLNQLIDLFEEDKVASLDCDDLYTSRQKLTLHMLPDISLSVSLFPQDIQWDDFLPSLHALTLLSPEVMEEIKPRIIEEYEENREVRLEDYPTEQEQLTQEGSGRGFESLEPPRDASEILRLVQFTAIHAQPTFDKKAVSLSICANVAWDEEHQIALDFRGGTDFKWISEPGAGC